MAINITDNKGRNYRFTDAEESLLQGLLDKNASLKAELIISIIEFDNWRIDFTAKALRGEPTPGYGGYSTAKVQRSAALSEISRHYDECMLELKKAFGVETVNVILENKNSLLSLAQNK